MGLFQKSVEKKYLSELDTVLIDQKYKQFQDYFGNLQIQENIRNAKEEQFQEGFLRELFVSIFGYTLNPQPNFNLTTELKNILNSRKVDGAILKGEDAIAVIELKGTDTTDLDKIETQAFGYKNHHPKCIYVITSNFEKLRFYIQNAVDYVDFDLFKLSREQFALMWLCLAKDNLLNELPLKIKESSVVKEEDITKQLYADYAKFREAIYQNLVKNNPETDKLLLFKKTQKLLDRFLFIFFAEDRLLLPPNSINEIVKQWTTLKDELDEYIPLYDRFKKYFGYMNTGYKGKKYDIYAYNGGLFTPDEILDNITIDDDILHEHTLRLSNYDFETDVDVNILGHIFEHSLGDIESVQAEIASGDGNNKGLQPLVQSKRKKDGIFYTPKYITKYIVENTIGKLCEEKRTALNIVDEEFAKERKSRRKDTIKALADKLTEYRNWLLSLTILDPACGSGAFLNQALDYLIKEHQKIDDLNAQLFGAGLVFSDITTDILEKNIYGVDLNEESVEIAKLSLWLRTAQKGRKLNKLNDNIKCGNSLIDDPDVAGDKAFNWQREFPNVFKKKDKKAWHVTFVTHDTRTSARMIKYNVRERQANGKMHIYRSVYLNEKDGLKVSEIIAEIVLEKEINCLAYNIGVDHVHMLLVCDEEELSEILRKLKGKSAQKFKEYLGISKEETYNLWAQKSDKKLILSEEQFQNTLNYIINNRDKHFESDENKGVIVPDSKERILFNKGLQPLVERMTCTREHAFRPEYTGGFDVVIGNPPYVRVQQLDYSTIDYLKNHFTTALKRIDISLCFIELSHKLIKKQTGLTSFITSNQFLTTEYGQAMRLFLINNYNLIECVDFGDLPVFADALTYVSIFTFIKEKNRKFNYYHVDSITNVMSNNYGIPQVIDINQLSADNWNLKNYSSSNIWIRIFENCKLISKIGNAWYGIITGADSIFIFTKEQYQSTMIENGLFMPLLRAQNCRKYYCLEPEKFVLYPYRKEGDKTILLTEEELQQTFPKGYQYLLSHKNELEARKDSRDTFKDRPDWYCLTRFGQFDVFNKLKIVTPGEVKQHKFCIDFANAGYSGARVFAITIEDNLFDIKYVLCLLNSNLLKSYLQSFSSLKNGGFYSYSSNILNKTPVKYISQSEQNDFIKLADKIYNLSMEVNQKQNRFINRLMDNLENVRISNNLERFDETDYKEFIKELSKQKIKLSLIQQDEWEDYFSSYKSDIIGLKSEIENIDNEINQKVYEVYGLTDEEIKIVEESI